mgnify:FL=1
MINCIKSSFYRVIRSKKNKIAIILIGLFVSLCFALNSVNATVSNYLNVDIYKGYDDRTLGVGMDLTGVDYDEIVEIENKIMSVEHIQSSFFSFYYFQGGTLEELKDVLDGQVNFTAANNDSVLEIVEGNNFPDDNGYYMICPENFYPIADVNKLKSNSLNDRYKLDDKIGDYFTFKGRDWVLGEEYSFKIKLVGLYKNQPNHNDENMCFVSKSVNEYIAKNIYKNDSTWSLEQYSLFMTVVDDVKNVEEATSNLENLGFSVTPITHIRYEYFEKIFNVVNKWNIAIFSLLIAFVIIYAKKDYQENKKHYDLLEMVGYNKNQLVYTIMFDIIIKLLFSFLVSILIVFVSNIFINILLIYKPFIFNKWSIIIDYSFYITIYLLLILLFAITYIINIFVKKN